MVQIRYMVSALGADDRVVRTDPRRERSGHGYRVHLTRSGDQEA